MNLAHAYANPNQSRASDAGSSAEAEDLRRRISELAALAQPPPSKAPASGSHAPAQAARGFDELMRTGYDAKGERTGTIEREASAPRAFGRAAVASALDTAAAPVVAVGQGAKALGYPNRAAELSGSDAVESLEYLARGKEPATVRRENEADTAWKDNAQAYGGYLASAAGMAIPGPEDLVPYALGGLAATVAKGAKKKSAEPAVKAPKPPTKKELAQQAKAAKEAEIAAENAKYDASMARMDEMFEKRRLERAEGWETNPQRLIDRERAAALHAKKNRNQDDRRALADLAFRELEVHPEYPLLREYTHENWSHEDWNRQLYSGNPTPEIQEKTRRLAAMLEDVRKKGHGDPGTVVQRGLSVPQAVYDKWMAADAIENQGFWSTSRSPKIAREFTKRAEGGPERAKLIMRLKQKTGMPVGGGEDEVLMGPGKKWLKKGIDYDAHGNEILDLEEVDDLPVDIIKALGSLDEFRKRQASRVV